MLSPIHQNARLRSRLHFSADLDASTCSKVMMDRHMRWMYYAVSLRCVGSHR